MKLLLTAPFLVGADRQQAQAHINPTHTLSAQGRHQAKPHGVAIETFPEPHTSRNSEIEATNEAVDAIFGQVHPALFRDNKFQKPHLKSNKNKKQPAGNDAHMQTVGDPAKVDGGDGSAAAVGASKPTKAPASTKAPKGQPTNGQDTFSWDSKHCVPMVNNKSAVPKESSTLTGCDLWKNASPQFAHELGQMQNQTDVDAQDLRTGSTCNSTTGRCENCGGITCGAGQICLSSYYSGADGPGCSCFWGNTPEDINKDVLDMACPGEYSCIHATEGSPMNKKNNQFPNATFFMGVCKKKGSSACFSGLSKVTTPSGDVAMQDLKVGQEIMTAAGLEKVLGWVHSNPTMKAHFMDISHSSGMLTLTYDHILYLADGSGIQAKDVRVGMDLASPEGSVKVTKVVANLKKGIYTPWTESNTVVVDGVLCSTFVEMASQSTAVHAVADFVMRTASQVVKMASFMLPASGEAPVRMLPSVSS